MRRIALPISVRLALFYGLTLLLLLSAFAVFCYTGFHLALHRDFDRHLTHEQRELLPFVAVNGEPQFEGLDRLTSVAYQTDGIYGTYVRLLSPTGEVLYRSPNFDGHEPLPVALARRRRGRRIGQPRVGEPSGANALRPSPRRRSSRGVARSDWLRVELAPRATPARAHARARRALERALRLPRRVVAGPAHAPPGRGDDRGGAADERGRGARGVRFPPPADFGPPDELTELAQTFNGLLARLEASVARERRFTANAAHELLTPLVHAPQRGRGRPPTRARGAGLPRGARQSPPRRRADDGDGAGLARARPRRDAREASTRTDSTSRRW